MQFHNNNERTGPVRLDTCHPITDQDETTIYQGRMITKQHFGSKLIGAGWINDSEGNDLDRGKLYNVTTEGDDVKTIYRVGIPAKRVNKPIRKRA